MGRASELSFSIFSLAPQQNSCTTHLETVKWPLLLGWHACFMGRVLSEDLLVVKPMSYMSAGARAVRVPVVSSCYTWGTASDLQVGAE